MRSIKILKGLKGNKKAVVFLTKNAEFDCKEYGILPDVAMDLVTDASEFLLKKNEGECFAVVCTLPQMVICGEVVYTDEMEMEIVINKVYYDQDIVFLQKKYKNDVFKINS